MITMQHKDIDVSSYLSKSTNSNTKLFSLLINDMKDRGVANMYSLYSVCKLTNTVIHKDRETELLEKISFNNDKKKTLKAEDYVKLCLKKYIIKPDDYSILAKLYMAALHEYTNNTQHHNLLRGLQLR